EATRQAVTRWAEGQVLAFNVIKPEERANSVTCVLIEGRDPRPLLDYCRFKCGVIPGQGIGELSGGAFRIAPMGHVNAPRGIGAVGGMEMGLTGVGIPHGRGGVQAAVEYLAREVPA